MKPPDLKNWNTTLFFFKSIKIILHLFHPIYTHQKVKPLVAKKHSNSHNRADVECAKTPLTQISERRAGNHVRVVSKVLLSSQMLTEHC